MYVDERSGLSKDPRHQKGWVGWVRTPSKKLSRRRVQSQDREVWRPGEGQTML